MDKTKAFEIWENLFGDNLVAYDFASHPMKKEDFQNKDSHYGWDIDEIKPYLNRMDNNIPCSINTINFRQKKNSFKVGNNLFEVRKGKVYGTFSIYDITDRNNPINMEPTPENQDPTFNRERFHQIAVSKNHSLNNKFNIVNPKSIINNVLNERLEENDISADDFSYLFEDEEENELDEETVVEDNLQEETIVEENNIQEEVTPVETESQVNEEAINEEPITEEEVTEENSSLDTQEIETPIVEENVTQEINEDHHLIEDESLEEEEIVQEEVMDDNLAETPYETIERLKKELQEKEDLISSLSDEKENMKKENEEMKISLEGDKKQIDEILVINETLKNQINQQLEKSNSDLETLKKEKDQLESELSESKDANVSLSEQMNMIQADSTQNLESLRLKNEELENKNSSLIQEKENILSQLESLKNQNEIQDNDKNLKIDELTHSLEEKEHNYQELSSKLSSFQILLDEKDKEKESLKSSLTDEKISLVTENDKLKEEILKLRQENEEILNKSKNLEENYNQLNAQNELTDGQISTLNDENDKLVHELEQKNIQLDEINKKYSDSLMEKEELEKKIQEGNEAVIKLQSELKVNEEERQRNVAKSDILTDKVTKLENDYDSLKNEKEKLSYDITTLQNESDQDKRKILYLSLNGKIEFFEDAISYLNENRLDFNSENLLSLFDIHPEMKNESEKELEAIKGEATLLDTEVVEYSKEERIQKDKAMNFFDQIYSLEKNEVSDFAGRFIRLDEYRNENSEYGWDYRLFDKDGKEEKDNLFIANLKTLNDYCFDKKFESNSHVFEVIKENGKYKIASSTFISDPYDFSQAIRVTRNNQSKISPLIYIFVKVSGLNTSAPDKEALLEFFDLMDCSSKRACPESFVEMKTVTGGNGNYALITFDGNIKNSYKEVLDYTILLNSYRREYWKQGKLNAVIVLNEVDVPFSKRHLDYDALLTETKDDELRALKYEFNMAVINSTIKRTIHIGPRILDKLPLDQNLLKPSQIGQGNFAQMYRFNKEFKVYNFVYSLSHKEEESKE